MHNLPSTNVLANKLHLKKRGTKLYLWWLFFIVVLGLLFRSVALFSWDDPSGRLHPDERFFTDVASLIRIPTSADEYLDSSQNTLNPRNAGKSLYVYGLLPQTITRLTAVVLTPNDVLHATVPLTVSSQLQVPNPELRVPKLTPLIPILNPKREDLTSYWSIYKVGRAWSTFWDCASIVLVFLIGRRLYGRRVGLLAALFYALSVLPIQLAHFFTVDATTAFFTLLTIYWAVRIAQDGGWGSFVALGLSIGAAMACRITLGTLALVGVLAVVARWLDDGRRTTDDESEPASADITSPHPVTLSPHHLVILSSWLVLAGVIAFFTFRVLQPDAFIGSAPGTPLPEGVQPTAINRFFQGKGFFDIRPEPRFLSNIQQASGFVSGEIDFPPGIQWAARTPFWFSWKNMVLWGMGLPLGLAAWLGWAVAGWRLFRHRALVHLIPWVWIAFYYVWQGGQFVMTMRYYSLLYGLLAVFAAWFLVGRRTTDDGRRTMVNTHRIPSFVIRHSSFVIVVGTLLWAYAFTRIYTEPHSRIQASRWIYDNIPPGASITYEQWDDPLPLPIDGRNSSQYKTIMMTPYAEDDLTKYIGGTDASGQRVPGMLDQLDQADYIILTSNRVYDSISRIPARYPALMRYYNALFNGDLGFKLAADVHSYPRLFGIEIPTPIYAEEAFSVYDHPRVLIFQKTPAYSRARAEQLITDPVAWDEVYKLSALRTGKVPTALRLTDAQWPSFRAAGTWAAQFSASSLWSWAPWLPWLVVLELLGLAMWVLLFRVLRGLPDRGFALAKTLGLLLVAYVGWLLASIGASDGVPLVSYTPWSARVYALLLIVAGGWVGWRNRAAMRAFARARRAALLTAEGLFLLAFFGFLIVRAFNPDLWHPARGGEKPMDLAFLTATLKSPAFPPYDPWFAGGYINYYYFGFVFIGTLIHITGIVPTVSYNLAVPTMFALTALGAWGGGYNLVAVASRRSAGSRRLDKMTRWQGDTETERLLPPPRTRSRTERRAIVTGLVAAVFVVLVGNMAQATWFLPGTAQRDDPSLSAACVAASSYAAQQACRGRSEWAFWDATRLVGMALKDSTINEFPFFTFLYGDLHAHMIALPLALAVLGLLVALVRQAAGRRRSAGGSSTRVRRLLPPAGCLLLLALAIGALRVTNTWDYPAYLGISVVALGLAAWRNRAPGASYVRIVGQWLLQSAVLYVLSSLFFLPFMRSFATDYAGIQAYTGARTPLTEFARVNGLWLFLLLSAAWVRFQAPGGRLRAVQVAAPLVGLVLLLAALLGSFSLSALLLLVPLVGSAVGVLVYLAFQDERSADEAVKARVSMPTLMVLLFAVSALGLALVPEIVTSKGDIGRMNTVFKLGMQSWTLFALAAAVAVRWLWHRVARLGQYVQIEWRGAVALVVFGALLYPITATPARLADRFDPQIGPTLDGAAFLQSASWTENGKSFSLRDDADAITWIQYNVSGTPIILEAQTDAYRWGARVSTYTGLPTLLGWPGHEQQQRAVAQVTPVLQSREALIQQIYDQPRGDIAYDLLRKYGIEYVYVGQLERALYDPAGLAKFDAMAAAGQIERVYDQNGTCIYRIPQTGAPPAVLTTSVSVRPPTTSQSTLLLDRPVGELPEVNEYAWNPLAQSSVSATIFWLLASYVLLLLGLPLAVLVFGRWRDGGYTWARLVGLLLLGYAVWLPVSARLWYYNRVGMILGLALVVSVDVVVLALLGRRINDERRRMKDAEASSVVSRQSSVAHGFHFVRQTLAARWRRILLTEALFLAAFALMTTLRALNPDLWQPIWGGEKPFEFGLLNAILRSPVMPPYSPFFSDGVLNYYYYGFFLVSLPIKATGIPPAIGFNLAIATLFALMVIGAFTLVAQLTHRVRYGLLGVAFVTIFGNFAAVFASGWSAGLPSVISALQGGLSGFGMRLDAWFVGPSRVIPNTINEFPAWSFLFADLHPHLIALPITLLAIALGFSIFDFRLAIGENLRPRSASLSPGHLVTLSLSALTLGALAITNSWDFPTYALLLGGALLGEAWRAPDRLRLRAFGSALLTIVGMVGGALLLYLPFFQNFQAQVRGISAVASGTDIRAYLLIYGLFLAVLVPTLFGAAWRLLQRRDTVAEHAWPRSSAALHFAAPSLSRTSGADMARRERLRSVLAIVAILLLVVTAMQPVLALKLWLVLLLALAVGVLLSRRVAPTTWFAYLMAVIAWAVSLGFEVIFVRDHLAGGDWERMNTVFKFGLQAWVLMALAAAALVPVLLHGLRRLHTVAETAGMAVLLVLCALAAVFPLAGVPSRVAYRFPVSPAPTLDGLAFMQDGTYTYQDQQIDLRYDGEAIAWINKNIKGTPVVLQSSLEFYRAYGVRVAANTGLPTVVSPLHESEQRDPAAVSARDADVQQVYSTSDVNEMLRLLSHYRVQYVYVGPIERAAYGEQGVAKFDLLTGQYFDIAYQNAGVKIFEVRPEVLSMPGLPPVSGAASAPALAAAAPSGAQVSLEALAAQAKARPEDAGLAFDLALRYRAQGRLEDAAAVLGAAAPFNPKDVALHHLWGDLLRDLGRTDEAIIAYRLAAQAVPTPANYNKLGTELFKLGKLDDARLAFAQALSLGNTETAPYFYLGQIYQQQGDLAQARKNYEQYLSVAPNGEYRAQATSALEQLK